MFNESDSLILKKILYPLFFSLTWGMLTYTFNTNNSDVLLTILTIIAIGTFLYSLWNIWFTVNKQSRVKMYVYISIFVVFFHTSTALINSYFQGIIATVYGVCLLVVFWKMITKKDNKDTAH